MAKLIYAAITSLDGFTNDARGEFGWAAPDAEVHQFVNDLERSVGTYLYGRRMYEVMRYWETAPTEVGRDADSALAIPGADYAGIWQAADKVVYSALLEAVSSARTRIEPVFDVDAVKALKSGATEDLSVGGAHLAASAIRAGLVDELHLFQHPVIVGAGTHWLPDDVFVELELLDERRFDSGVVHLHHRVVSTRPARDA